VTKGQSISGETRWKTKSRKTKTKVVRLHREWSEIDGCQKMEEESRREICMCYRCEAGTGYTVRTVCQWRRPKNK
jgi:hypothetical protein